MAIRNPYSEYSRRGDEMDDGGRQALLDALDEPQTQPMSARPRTPARTPQQTREMLDSPGGRTQIIDRNRDVDDGRDLTNAFSGEIARPYADSAASGDRWQDERQTAADEPPTPPAGNAAPGGQGFPTHTGRGRELLDQYDDYYDRRGGYGGLEPTRKKISMGLLTSGEPYSMVSGAFGMLDAWLRRRAESAPTDFNVANAREIISEAHKDALGREITPEYLDQIIAGQGWEQGDRYVGEDALMYVLDQFYQHADAERAQRGPEIDAAGAAAAAGASPTDTGGGLPFSGFDFNRAQDPSTSAKDAFASLAQQAPPMTDTSKAGAEAWFRQHIAPGMEAAGYKIYDLQGDKAWVGSREDPEGRTPVDWLINAGGSNVQIGWQPESGGGGGAMGDAPADIPGAYAYLKSIAHPGMSRAEMESAITQAFGNVPGFERGYAGDVVIGGKKLDLITDFEGANPQWSDNLTFVPLHGGGTSAVPSGSGGVTAQNLAPGAQLAAPLGRSDVLAQIQAELQRIMSGAPPRDELLEALG